MAGLSNGRAREDHWNDGFPKRVHASDQGKSAFDQRSPAPPPHNVIRDHRVIEERVRATASIIYGDLDGKPQNGMGDNSRYARRSATPPGASYRDYFKIAMIACSIFLVVVTIYRINQISMSATTDTETISRRKKDGRMFTNVYILPEDFSEKDMPPVWRGIALAD